MSAPDHVKHKILLMGTDYFAQSRCVGAVVVPPDSLEFVQSSVVERRRDIRIIVSLPGRYWLPDRRDAGGDRQQFACRAINISPRAVALTAPVSGRIGEPVIADIDRLGRLKGAVARLLERGFVISIAADDEERSKLADKIEWLEKHKNFDAHDQRTSERFIPKQPCSTLILPDGTRVRCLVMDLSVSGAAISSEAHPPIGMVLAIGTVIGRVVRHFAGGFAVKFVTLQERDSVEAMIIR